MLDPLFRYVGNALSTPEDYVKLVFCLLIAYPLSSLYVKLPTDGTRHYYSILVATFFLVGILKLWSGFLQLLFSIVGTYLIVVFNRTERMPWLVFAFTMGHLTINHVYRTIYEISPDVIEITGTQMVLVMKLSSFAWNVYDGRRDINDLDESQRASRLTKLPGLHSFLGYALFFPSVLVGPSFDFQLYHSLVNGKLFVDAEAAATPTNAPSFSPSTGTTSALEATSARTPLKRTASFRPEDIQNQPEVLKRGIPKGRKRVGYVHGAVGVAFLAVYALFGSKATYEGVLTDEWKGYSAAFKLLYVQACGFMARTKYYGVWELTEGAVILCGLGFNGYDPTTGRTRWNRVRNIDILRIETAENYKVLFDNWNMRTSVWLRECVYKRVTPKGKKPGFQSSMITFMTSAFWHGTQIGYYFTFVHAGFLTSLGRLFRRNIRPLVLEQPGQPQSQFRQLAKRAYDILGWLTVQITLNYIVSTFLLLHLAPSVRFYNRTWWYGDLLIAASFGFFKVGGAQKVAKALGMSIPKKAERSTKAGAAEETVKHVVEDTTSADVTDDHSRRPSIVIHPPPPPTSAAPVAPSPSDLLAGAAPSGTASSSESTTTASEEADWEIIGSKDKSPAKAEL